MSLWKVIAAGSALLISANVMALSGSMSDLKNVCDHVASPKELRLINATALMVANDPAFIQYNASTNTYSITNEAFVTSGGVSICQGSPFYGEPHINGNAGRTGFLIAPDKIMTAAHASPANFTPNHWLIVFRSSKTSGEDAGCTNFTWENIPAANVYYPNGAVANTHDEIPEGKYDYAVIQLNRPVTDRRPLRVRRSGGGRSGDLLVAVGYPNRGGEKIDTNGVLVLKDAPPGTRPFDSNFQLRIWYSGNDALYNIHGLDGSSGSPIYNVDDDVVESAISYGYSSDIPAPVSGCTSVVQTNFIGDTNGRLADVQSEIPRSEVLVRPMDYIEHILPLNPPAAVFSNHYSIESARPNGGELVNVGAIIGPSGDPSKYPVVASTMTSGGRLVPVSGLQFDISADASSVASCGIYDYELNVKDVTNDFNNVIRRRFEIGMKAFSLEPSDAWELKKLGLPYEDARTYTVRNVRPTATHVMVSTYAGYPFKDFLRVNGGGLVSLDLGPAGSSTDSATVVVSINQTAADGLPMNVVHQGRIVFYHQPFNCAVPWQSSYVNRDVSFLKGQQLVESQTEPDLLPIPASGGYGSPLRFEIDLSGMNSGPCVKDLNVTIGLPSPALTLGDAAQTLKLVLVSPSGMTRTLWNGNQVPGQNYIVTIYDETLGYLESLYLDDQIAPPLGGSLLSAFSGRPISGKWFLDASTSSASGLVGAGPARIEFARADNCLDAGL